MKGKKTDPEFISDFIKKSVDYGFDTPELIYERAKSMVSKIDRQIKRIEKRKVVRSNLLDVISQFEKVSKNKTDNLFSFFNIKNQDISKNICGKLKDQSIKIAELKQSFPELDLYFCIKQLIEYRVISKTSDIIFRGKEFDNYLEFIK